VTAARLVQRALDLRQFGQLAPGGKDTWAGWERDAEAWLRDLAALAAALTDPGRLPAPAADYPDPKCPAAFMTDRAASGFVHCVLDPVTHGYEDWHEDPDSGRWKVTLAMGGFPVSGRAEPRVRAEPVTHELRFYGCHNPPSGVMVVCEPCGWHPRLEDGHTLEELTRLAVQHEGGES
jgi:hypothetical protein